MTSNTAEVRWLTFILLVSLCSAAQATVVELRPSGTGDDTAQLQGALTRCTNVHKPCHLRLGDGVFHTDVLLVKAFHGSIMGRGEGRTIIRPLEHRALRSSPMPFTHEPTLAQPYPVLLHFTGGGKVSMSHLTLDFPASMTVGAYDYLFFESGVTASLVAAILVEGDQRAEFWMRSVSIAGVANESFLESNVSTAVMYGGKERYFGDGDQTVKLQSGHVRLVDVTTRGVGIGASVRDADGINVTLTSNDFGSRVYSVFTGDLGDSHVTILGNRIRSEVEGVLMTRDQRPAQSPSNYLVTLNRIVVTGGSLGDAYDGVGIYDFSEEPETIQDDFNIVANDIRILGSVIAGVSVDSDGPGDVRIVGNRIRGAPLDAGVRVDLSRGTFIAANDLRGVSGDVPDVHLHPDTRHCRVIAPNDTVRDEGTDNRVTSSD